MTTAPRAGAGGCPTGLASGPCASFTGTLFQESSLELLGKAKPLGDSREVIASLAAVLDGGDPGERWSPSHSVASPKVAIGDGKIEAGSPSQSCPSRPEPRSAAPAVQTVKIKDEVEEEDVAIIADPGDTAAVSLWRSWWPAAEEVARPMEGLGEVGPTPFLRKTYEMVSDPGSDPMVSWGSSLDSFVVWDQHEFSKQVLPRYFKHSNFASFVRQLNTYGFRKIDTDRWEFANEDFRGGKKHLLKNIKRRGKFSKQRKTSSTAVNTDYLRAEKEAELETLKKDQEMLKAKILKLREERENSQHEINQVAERVQSAECRQQQMFLFLSKATKYPNFVQHVIEKRRQKRELDTRESSKSSKLLGLDGETTKCLLEAMNPKIQSPNVDCLQISDNSAQIESHPNSVVPEDFETIQMHNLWPSMPEQMAGASPPHLSLVFNEMSDKLLGDYVGVGDDAADVEEVEEDLAVNDTRIYLELEGLIEKPCGWSEYTSELVGRAAGLMP